MADLAQKIITYMGGTRREIIEHGVEGLNWTFMKYVELGVGFGLFVSSTEDFPKGIGVYLVANAVVRYANMFYDMFKGDRNLEHFLAPYPGVVGTIRETTK